MNFIKWLLSRTKRTLLGEGQWQWIYEYRRLIIRSKVESILVTIFGGLVWFLIMFGVGALLLPTKEEVQTFMELTLLSIPTFYIYNWLGALYEIYDAERIATWDRLKEPHR